MVKPGVRVGQKYRLENGKLGVVVEVSAVRGAYLGHTSWKDYLSQFQRTRFVVAYEDGNKIRTEEIYS